MPLVCACSVAVVTVAGESVDRRQRKAWAKLVFSDNGEVGVPPSLDAALVVLDDVRDLRQRSPLFPSLGCGCSIAALVDLRHRGRGASRLESTLEFRVSAK